MKHRQKGLVLITTLMFILISSLLVLRQMQLFLLDNKVLNQFKERQKSFRSLENAALSLMAEVDLQSECRLREDSANLVVDLLQKNGGCLFSHEQQSYYYLIEDFGLFPCLQVQKDHLTYSTQHLRLSLRSEGKQPAILQIRYAKLANYALCTMQKPKQARLGVLSWRVLRPL